MIVSLNIDDTTRLPHFLPRAGVAVGPKGEKAKSKSSEAPPVAEIEPPPHRRTCEKIDSKTQYQKTIIVINDHHQ